MPSSLIKLYLGSIFTPLREGQYVFPGLRHDFEWEPQDIIQSMRSIFCNYYN